MTGMYLIVVEEENTEMLRLPTDKCHVIKNGVTHFPERQTYKKVTDCE